MKKGITNQKINSVGGKTINKGEQVNIIKGYVDCTGKVYDIKNGETLIIGVPKYKVDII